MAFAFIKASDGLNMVDPLFNHNWSESKAKNIPRGAYHFFRPQSDPYAQAQHFLKTLEAQPTEMDLPAVLDFEVEEPFVQSARIVDSALSWLVLVEKATGRKPIVYTSPSIMSSYGHPVSFESFPLWLAHYGVPQPTIPKPWTAWTFWQYTESGMVGSNKFDLNWFNGDEAALLKL